MIRQLRLFQWNLSFQTSLFRHRNYSLWSSQLSLFVYTKMDLLMLPIFSISMGQIGLYAYTYSLFSVFLLLPTTIQNILLKPLMDQDVKGSFLWRKLLAIYIFISTASTIMFIAAVPYVVNILFEEAPIQALIQALAPGLFIVFFANLLGIALLTEGHENFRSKVQWLAAICNFCLNLWAIPKFGIIGAAAATSFSYFVLFFGFLYGAYKFNCWGLANTSKSDLKI